jgi:hypothetical protein
LLSLQLLSLFLLIYVLSSVLIPKFCSWKERHPLHLLSLLGHAGAACKSYRPASLKLFLYPCKRYADLLAPAPGSGLSGGLPYQGNTHKNAVPTLRIFRACPLTAGAVFPNGVINIVEDDFRTQLVLLYHIKAQFVV